MGKMRWTRAALAAVLALAAAACGGSKPPTKRVVAPVVTSSASVLRARAQSIVLTAADFPSGWTGSAHTEDPTDKEFERRLRACSGVAVGAAKTIDVFGDDFDLTNLSVGSEAQYFPSAALVRTDITSVNNSRVLGCIRTILVDLLKVAIAKQGVQGATLRSISLNKLPFPRHGDVSEALRLTATVSISGQQVRFFQDVVVAGKGKMEATASFFNIGAVFPTALERSLFATMAARLIKDGGA